MGTRLLGVFLTMNALHENPNLLPSNLTMFRDVFFLGLGERH